MTQMLQKSLFSVIRFALGEGEDSFVLTAEDCSELLRVASRQSILPIVYDSLRRMNAPKEALEPYTLSRLKDGYDSIQRNDALMRIRAALDSDGVPYILLKGSVLRRLYPDPDWRTSCDIDVLVPEERLEDAIRVIEANTDLHAKQRHYHDTSMIDGDMHLELHFSIKENMDSIDRLLVHVWDHAVASGEGCCMVLTPEFQVFHVVAHMSYHMTHGGLGIRPFLDLWLLRNKTEFDESTVRQMCEQCGILTFYEVCCQLVDAWMEDRVIPPEMAVLERYCLSGGVFGSYDSAVASLQREHRGASYYLHRVFMTRSLLETKYPALKEKPLLMPYYQVKRWIGLFNRKKRKRVYQEIKDVRNTDVGAIDAFDRLLTELGL